MKSPPIFLFGSIVLIILQVHADINSNDLHEALEVLDIFSDIEKKNKTLEPETTRKTKCSRTFLLPVLVKLTAEQLQSSVEISEPNAIVQPIINEAQKSSDVISPVTNAPIKTQKTVIIRENTKPSTNPLMQIKNITPKTTIIQTPNVSIVQRESKINRGVSKTLVRPQDSIQNRTDPQVSTQKHVVQEFPKTSNLEASSEPELSLDSVEPKQSMGISVIPETSITSQESVLQELQKSFNIPKETYPQKSTQKHVIQEFPKTSNVLKELDNLTKASVPSQISRVELLKNLEASSEPELSLVSTEAKQSMVIPTIPKTAIRSQESVLDELQKSLNISRETQDFSKSSVPPQKSLVLQDFLKDLIEPSEPRISHEPRKSIVLSSVPKTSVTTQESEIQEPSQESIILQNFPKNLTEPAGPKLSVVSTEPKQSTIISAVPETSIMTKESVIQKLPKSLNILRKSEDSPKTFVTPQGQGILVGGLEKSVVIATTPMTSVIPTESIVLQTSVPSEEPELSAASAEQQISETIQSDSRITVGSSKESVVRELPKISIPSQEHLLLQVLPKAPIISGEPELSVALTKQQQSAVIRPDSESIVGSPKKIIIREFPKVSIPSQEPLVIQKNSTLEEPASNDTQQSMMIRSNLESPKSKATNANQKLMILQEYLKNLTTSRETQKSSRTPIASKQFEVFEQLSKTSDSQQESLSQDKKTPNNSVVSELINTLDALTGIQKTFKAPVVSTESEVFKQTEKIFEEPQESVMHLTPQETQNNSVVFQQQNSLDALTDIQKTSQAPVISSESKVLQQIQGIFDESQKSMIHPKLPTDTVASPDHLKTKDLNNVLIAPLKSTRAPVKLRMFSKNSDESQESLKILKYLRAVIARHPSRQFVKNKDYITLQEYLTDPIASKYLYALKLPIMQFPNISFTKPQSELHQKYTQEPRKLVMRRYPGHPQSSIIRVASRVPVTPRKTVMFRVYPEVSSSQFSPQESLILRKNSKISATPKKLAVLREYPKTSATTRESIDLGEYPEISGAPHETMILGEFTKVFAAPKKSVVIQKFPETSTVLQRSPTFQKIPDVLLRSSLTLQEIPKASAVPRISASSKKEYPESFATSQESEKLEEPSDELFTALNENPFNLYYFD